MSSHLALVRALAEVDRDERQRTAVLERGHCVVLAGPGSGKTKTLTTAMARTLLHDVQDPRGVACITYSNECAGELEMRLKVLGITQNSRIFIGTVHSFALSHVLAPYARCLPDLVPPGFRVASNAETRAAVETAHSRIVGDGENPHERWLFAQEKRRRDVDRKLPNWRAQNPLLADLILAYESELRRQHLVDFDDMPLIAFRMVAEHRWIRDALRARFPVLFVDEYQDLGHALHELVLLLCFDGGIRLFAVGDADQSIYGFNGANPDLLRSLTALPSVKTVSLRFNYRSGSKIIQASLGALGEDRDYQCVDGAPDGELIMCPVDGSHDAQADTIAKVVIPQMLGRGIAPEQIAVLYRAAWLGDKVAAALRSTLVPFDRTDGNALVRRNSQVARFVVACAAWVTGGWRDANPSYSHLLRQAIGLVYGAPVSEVERETVSLVLIRFLRRSHGLEESAHVWLRRFYGEVVEAWRGLSRNPHAEWDICWELVTRTDPALSQDMSLSSFSGRSEGTGQVTLSTLHSAKGREFHSVILFGINSGDIPSRKDNASPRALREARRLFYVGVTRPRRELCLVYQKGHHSPWVYEVYKRSRQG